MIVKGKSVPGAGVRTARKTSGGDPGCVGGHGSKGCAGSKHGPHRPRPAQPGCIEGKM